jgi:hypothetical protein
LDYFSNLMSTWPFIPLEIFYTNKNLKNELDPGSEISALHICLSNIISPILIQQLTELILPPAQNIPWNGKQITPFSYKHK